jgi:hypothetical protein
MNVLVRLAYILGNVVPPLPLSCCAVTPAVLLSLMLLLALTALLLFTLALSSADLLGARGGSTWRRNTNISAIGRTFAAADNTAVELPERAAVGPTLDST